MRRWSSEVQEVANSKSPVVQFHALALLHRIRKVDKLAISKLVSHLTRNVIRSPLAQCLVIRYVAQVWYSGLYFTVYSCEPFKYAGYSRQVFRRRGW